MKGFNNSCAPDVGAHAQAACGDCAGCSGTVYALELYLSVFIHTISLVE